MQSLDKKIDEYPHARRHIGSSDEDGVDHLHIAGIIVFQERDKPSRGDFINDAERTNPGDADAINRQLPQRLSIIRLDPALDGQGIVATILAKRPDRFGATKIEVQAIVMVQIFRNNRRSMQGQIIWRRHDDASGFPQFARR